MSHGDVFINCPFSDDYAPFFQALTFSVLRCGFTPRCAQESDDGGEVRFEKICRLIRACPFGIHDISYTELDEQSGLPRFNMPFELGLFLGARSFGATIQRRKKALIFDRERYRYQKFLSDIAGQDITSHNGKSDTLIEKTTRWLRDEAGTGETPGGRAVVREFKRFELDLPSLARGQGLEPDELTFKELRRVMATWMTTP